MVPWVRTRRTAKGFALAANRKESPMTDTATAAPGGGISVSPDSLRQKLNEINEIDSQLDAASDSKGAGKRAVANQLASEHGAQGTQIVEQISQHLNNVETPVLAGIFTQLVSDLNARFKSRVDTYLEQVAEANKAENAGATISETEIATLSEARKRLNEEYKALRSILEMFGQDVSGIPTPKKRTGKAGKRGPRASSQIVWTVDGETKTGTEGKFANVAKNLGFPGDNLRSIAKSFREWIEANVETTSPSGATVKVDLSDPPSQFSFNAPNGQRVVGNYEVDEADAALEEDDEDENDE